MSLQLLLIHNICEIFREICSKYMGFNIRRRVAVGIRSVKGIIGLCSVQQQRYFVTVRDDVRKTQQKHLRRSDRLFDIALGVCLCVCVCGSVCMCMCMRVRVT